MTIRGITPYLIVDGAAAAIEWYARLSTRPRSRG